MTYWVIREGTVRGEGRYWGPLRAGGFGGQGWTDRHSATRYEWRDFFIGENARFVRVVPKAKAKSVDLAAVRSEVRERVLARAERLCRRKAADNSRTITEQAMALECADAIALLRGAK